MRSLSLIVFSLAAVGCAALAPAQDPEPDQHGIYIVQPGITRPHLIHAATAEYPANPGVADMRHACVVRTVVGPDGTVTAVDVENSEPSPFDQAAMKAVSQSSFSPGTLRGQPVPVETELYVVFRGAGNPAIPSMQRAVSSFRNPRPTYDPNAEYSNKARKARVSGTVLLSFVVREDGTTSDIRVIRKLGAGLDEEAIKAVRQWRFEPATIDGNPIPDRITTEMSFHLQ
jgi:TonB family protein